MGLVGAVNKLVVVVVVDVDVVVRFLQTSGTS